LKTPREFAAPGDDDLSGGGHRPAARRRCHGHRVAGAKPLALVVVGGMTLAPVLILLVLPVLIGRYSKHVPNKYAVAHGRMNVTTRPRT
jgi:hypothetical protein